MTTEAQKRANKRWEEKHRGICVDCGCIVSRNIYARCKSCSHTGKKLSEKHVTAIQKGLRGNKGETNPNWRGGRRTTNKGYVRCYSPSHPLKDIDGYVLEHRLIVEKAIGRYLKTTEVVHHINGIKNDNRLENLMLFFCDTSHRRYEKGLTYDRTHILFTGLIHGEN